MKDRVKLEIATPNGLFVGTFPNTTKVKDVIQAAAEDRDLVAGDSFELVHDGEVLQPAERTLVSFGLTGTVMLELVATGSGV
jgi:hypothetical protein